MSVRERFRVASFRAPFRLLVLNGVGVFGGRVLFFDGFFVLSEFCLDFVLVFD